MLKTKQRRFELKTLKNLRILMTSFEPHFRSLYQPERVVDTERVKPQTELFPGLGPCKTAIKIQKRKDVQEIANVFHRSGRLLDKTFAYGLAPRVSGSRPKSIEF